uniref:Uncharacterized protein n=1 Tax=Myoviridae sp. ctQQg4 TaxID=2827686 RepID=A0A8S5T8D6_9CAUD|nr:MAG TPA: hypothetical protein [Myoviridae sp. ctQQg4]
MIRCLWPWINGWICPSSDSNRSISHAYMRC